MNIFTDAQKKKIAKTAQKILKLPGNAPKGDVLEMALVLDCSLEREFLCEAAKDILVALRSLGKPFLNIRLNLIKWKSDEELIKYVSSYPEMLMGRAADEKDILAAPKHLDPLLAQLNKFYARSRIILMLADRDYSCLDTEAAMTAAGPFVAKKTLSVHPDGDLTWPLEIKVQTTGPADEGTDNTAEEQTDEQSEAEVPVEEQNEAEVPVEEQSESGAPADDLPDQAEGSPVLQD